MHSDIVVGLAMTPATNGTGWSPMCPNARKGKQSRGIADAMPLYVLYIASEQ